MGIIGDISAVAQIVFRCGLPRADFEILRAKELVGFSGKSWPSKFEVVGGRRSGRGISGDTFESGGKKS